MGGFAGLAATNMLSSTTQVIVLERAASVSGRASAHRRDGQVFDIGAQYLDPSGAAFKQRVRELGAEPRQPNLIVVGIFYLWLLTLFVSVL